MQRHHKLAKRDYLFKTNYLLSGPKNYPFKKKFKGNCLNCEKVKHNAKDCRAPKKEKKKDQANIFEKNEEMLNLCVILSEYNLIGNSNE